MKIVLGIILVLIVARVLFAVIDLNGANDQSKSATDGSAITVGDFESVKVGRTGNSRERIEARFGEPQTEQDLDSGDVKGFDDSGPGRECIYYNWKGKQGSLFQFCLDAETQRARSKQGLFAVLAVSDG